MEIVTKSLCSASISADSFTLLVYTQPFHALHWVPVLLSRLGICKYVNSVYVHIYAPTPNM